MLQPSEQDYQNIINIIMTVPFVLFQGWNASHVGWYWGGMTIQGVLPYYYYRISPGRILKLDRCIYNTMADTIPCRSGNADRSCNTIRIRSCHAPS